MVFVKFIPMGSSTPAQALVADQYEADEIVERLVKAVFPNSSPVMSGGDYVYDGRCYCGCCDGWGATLGTVFFIPVEMGEIIFG